MATNGEVRKALEEPFPAEWIKSRPGSFGQDLSYVEAHRYIERLNQAFVIAGRKVKHVAVEKCGVKDREIVR